MDARLQRRVQRYGWDKASAWYERYWRQQLQPAQERVLALAQRRPRIRRGLGHAEPMRLGGDFSHRRPPRRL